MLVTGSNGPFPFITKDGSLSSFSTVSTSEFNNDFVYGSVITGSYPLSASAQSLFFPTSSLYVGKKRELLALKNTFNYYTNLSNHYEFSSSLGNKEEQPLRLISIPSILYGQEIKKRSVSCRWYLTGSLIAELQDQKGNGELIQVGPSGSNGSGSVAGVVLYTEGFICLTGSWSLHSTYVDKFDVYDNTTDYSPSWKYFLTTGSGGSNEALSSSFLVDFEGTEKIPTITMIAKAEKGEFNHSNNPTYIEWGQDLEPVTGSNRFLEKSQIQIKNIVDTNYDDEDPTFQKITYISKVAIYDKDKNLIGMAKLANPIRKTVNNSVAIKMKLDM
jgi:hypothetical protein